MKINIRNIALLASMTFAISCTNNTEDFTNNLYIPVHTPNYIEELLFQATKPTDEKEIYVEIAKLMNTEVTATVGVQGSLDKYKVVYDDDDDNLVMLPEDSYKIENQTVKIPVGGTRSTKATIKFMNLDKLDRDKRYVLPIYIKDVYGVDLLASGSEFYYIFEAASLINTIPDVNGVWAYPSWDASSTHVEDLETLTMEGLVNLKSVSGKLISTFMGIEGNFLLRFGDAGIPGNQLQFATNQGNTTDENLQIDLNRWVHVAFTFDRGNVKFYFDGIEKYSATSGKTSASFNIPASDESGGKPRTFWIGYSYASDRTFDGEMSELRIWNKVLTAEEINAPLHFYYVDPLSEGLIAYWKLNEGEGGIAKDYSTYGNDLTFTNGFPNLSAPKWSAITLPPKD